jgi:hypothetical protein
MRTRRGRKVNVWRWLRGWGRGACVAAAFWITPVLAQSTQAPTRMASRPDAGPDAGRPISAALPDEVSDSQIVSVIERTLGQDQAARGTRVSVSSERNGVVTLSGVASSDAQKSRIIELAQGTRGVKVVIDAIETPSEGAPLPRPATPPEPTPLPAPPVGSGTTPPTSPVTDPAGATIPR